MDIASLLRGRACTLLLLIASMWTLAPAMGETPVVATKPVTTAPATATAQLSAQVKQYQALVQTLSADDMEGRGAGAKGQIKARDFIVEQFKAAGLAPALKAGFLQPFDIYMGREITDAALELKDGPGARAVAAKDEDFAPLELGASGKVSGAAVFVGYGSVNPAKSYDTYKGLAADGLKGKVAIVLRYEPQNQHGRSLWSVDGSWSPRASLTEKIKLAADHGAAAVILINPPSEDDDLGIQSSGMAGEFPMPIFQVSTAWAAKLLRAAGYKDADPLKSLQERADKAPVVEDLKGVTLDMSVKSESRHVDAFNVIGVIPGGGTLASQVVVVGAHYDHMGAIGAGKKMKVFHGADDNASGVSGLIMLARMVHERVAAGQAPADRRTVVFASFAGEELGLLGSEHMVEHLRDIGIDRSRIVAMLNMDMIGRMTGDRLNAYGSSNSAGWAAILKLASARTPLKLRPGGRMDASDHASFQAAKIPALEFCTGAHFDMHRPGDTADKINARGAMLTVRVVQDILEQVWAGKPDLAFKGAQPPPRLALGVMADAAPEGSSGVLVSAVRPGSVADRAGLKAGDLLVAWDKLQLKEPGDLLAAISQAKAGQTVALSVERDGKDVQLKATFAKLAAATAPATSPSR